MSNYRILVIGPHPWKRGGIPRVIANVTPREASHPALELAIYCSSPEESDLQCESYEGVPVKVFLQQRSFPYYPVGMFRELVRARERFDLFHIHGVASIETLIAAIALLGRPVVINSHYHLEASAPWLELFKKPFDWTVVRWLLRRVERIFCVSNLEAETLSQKFGHTVADKIVVIPNGVDYQAILQSSPYQSEIPLLLCTGRLEQFKNIHLIVDAVPHLPEEFCLYIIGKGPYREQLSHQISRLRVDSRVRLLGPVSDGELYRWLRTCSAFVTLSSYEAFGITVLEALAAQKPVVVNNKWGLRELAEAFPDAIVPVNAEGISPEALAHHIQHACQLHVNVDLKLYDWDTIAQRTASLHLQVCQQRGRS